jgi:hypothetical protein
VCSTLRLAGVVVLMSIVPGALAQDPAPPRRPSPARRRPIHDSIDRSVDAVVLAHLKPCVASERQGVPCFPVSVEEEGPRFSVADALRRYRADGSPAPGLPTVAEMQHRYPGRPGAPASAVGSFPSFDPVCTTKNLLKKVSGRSTTYHLYRMWDAGGERPLLTDRPLDPNTYRSNPDVHYEYLGKFDGECEAVAAWRKALRKATEPEPVPDDAWNETPRPPE